MQWTQVRRGGRAFRRCSWAQRPTLAPDDERQFPSLGAKTRSTAAAPAGKSAAGSFLQTLVAENPRPKPKAREPDVPLGWIRLRRDGSRTEHPNAAKDRREGEATRRRRTTIEEINRMLRMRQQERDIQNELLGAMSPYYDAWDITGPPGASDAEYSDDELEDYSSEDS